MQNKFTCTSVILHTFRAPCAGTWEANRGANKGWVGAIDFAGLYVPQTLGEFLREILQASQDLYKFHSPATKIPKK